jgi:outer membrane protein
MVLDKMVLGSMIKKTLKIILFSATLFLPTLVQADDLLDLYYQAQRTSPLLKSQDLLAQADALAGPIARAALFPVINLGASIARSMATGDINGTTSEYDLSLKQPLFNYASYQNWRSGQWQAKQSLSSFAYQRQTFILNVANAYFAVLQAEESLEYRVAARKSYSLTLDQTREQMKVGLSTQNDVKQALADYDSSVAEAIKAKNDLTVARLSLYVYTGEVSEHLAQLRDDFPFVKPVGNIDKWVKAAKFHNNSFIAQQDQLQSYAHILSSSRSTYLPAVSLGASYAYTAYNNGSSVFNALFPNNKRVGSVSLDLTWSLLNGGLGFETVKQNAANYASQEALTEYTQRNVVDQTRQDYLAVSAGSVKVKALKVAVESGEDAVKQALAQYQAGTVTIVNVLEQIRLLYQFKESYTQAKYDYIKSKLALAQDSGVLEEGDIKALNAWLTHDEPAKRMQISNRK